VRKNKKNQTQKNMIKLRPKIEGSKQNLKPPKSTPAKHSRFPDVWSINKRNLKKEKEKKDHKKSLVYGRSGVECGENIKNKLKFFRTEIRKGENNAGGVSGKKGEKKNWMNRKNRLKKLGEKRKIKPKVSGKNILGDRKEAPIKSA